MEYVLRGQAHFLSLYFQGSNFGVNSRQDWPPRRRRASHASNFSHHRGTEEEIGSAGPSATPQNDRAVAVGDLAVLRVGVALGVSCVAQMDGPGEGLFPRPGSVFADGLAAVRAHLK